MNSGTDSYDWMDDVDFFFTTVLLLEVLSKCFAYGVFKTELDDKEWVLSNVHLDKCPFAGRK